MGPRAGAGAAARLLLTAETMGADEVKTKKLFTDHGDRVTAVILEIGLEDAITSQRTNGFMNALNKICFDGGVNTPVVLFN